MKQKIVIEVCINDEKSRKKALKIAVSQSGVTQVALQLQDKNKIEVTGEGVDPVTLTTMLRKKVGYADLLNVSAVGDKKADEKKPTEKKDEAKVIKPPEWPNYDGLQFYHVYEVRDPSYADPACCTIM